MFVRGLVLAALAAVFAAPGLFGQQRFGAFVLERNRDAMTDADRSTLITREVGNSGTDRAALIFRCGDAEMRLVVVTPFDFLDNDDVSIQWRFDDDPASVPHTWSSSASGTGAFASSNHARHFLTRGRAANRVLIRVSDYRGVSRDLTFSLQGLTAGIAQLNCEPASHPNPGAVFAVPGVMAIATGQTGFVPNTDACDAWMLGFGTEFYDSIERAINAREEPNREARGACALTPSQIATADSIKAIYDMPASEAIPPAEAQYVGNRLTRRIFRLGIGCRAVRSLAPRLRVYFRTVEEATEAGYKPSIMAGCS